MVHLFVAQDLEWDPLELEAPAYPRHKREPCGQG